MCVPQTIYHILYICIFMLNGPCDSNINLNGYFFIVMAFLYLSIITLLTCCCFVNTPCCCYLTDFIAQVITLYTSMPDLDVI